ncbi:MAG: hypothetical protein R3D85_06820 [Paracoccaceae bacterium]
MTGTKVLTALGCALALALAPGGALRAQVETVAVIESPADWTRAEVGPISLSVPSGWRLVEDRKRTKIWFGGDMATITGPAVGLMMDRDPQDIFKPEEISTELPPLRLPGGAVFDRVRVSRALTDDVRIDSLVLRSQEPDADGYYLGVMVGGYNRDYEADMALYGRILGTFRLQGAAPVAAAPEAALEVVPMPSPANPVETTPLAALDGWLQLDLPEGWIVLGSTEDAALGLQAPGDAGVATLARGAAVDGPGGLLDAAPAASAHRRVGLARGEADLLEWQEGLVALRSRDETGAPGAGAHRLLVLRDCGPGGERVALDLAGSPDFLTGDAAATLMASLAPTLPDGSGPCAELARFVAPAPEPVAPKPDPEPASQVAALDTAGQGGATAAIVPPPPPPDGQGSTALSDGDRFTPQGGGYSLYVNDRYGTHISYPSDYFTAQEPPGNGDGRSFLSDGGAAQFYVFSQFNALGLPLDDQLEQDWQLGGYDKVTYQRKGAGWYVLSGYKAGDIFYRKVIYNGPDGLLRVFEITYPKAQKDAFDPVVAHMADSFGPAADAAAQPASPPPPPPVSSTAPQAGTSWPKLDLSRLHTPARKTAERSALMDAARGPIADALGQQVIFVVDVLNTDGTWAFLQARPLQPDGTPIDWGRTRFAHEYAGGMMSDIAMVLMLRQGGGWKVVDHVLGPTDVHWYGWLEPYGLPESFFLTR